MVPIILALKIASEGRLLKGLQVSFAQKAWRSSLGWGDFGKLSLSNFPKKSLLSWVPTENDDRVPLFVVDALELLDEAEVDGRRVVEDSGTYFPGGGSPTN